MTKKIENKSISKDAIGVHLEFWKPPVVNPTQPTFPDAKVGAAIPSRFKQRRDNRKDAEAPVEEAAPEATPAPFKRMALSVLPEKPHGDE